jgi:hypothetical protein
MRYTFYAGEKAQLIEDGPDGKVHELRAPAGEVETPAGPSTKWLLRLPAGTSVAVGPNKYRRNPETLSKVYPEASPEVMAEARKFAVHLLDKLAKERKSRLAKLKEEKQSG